MRGSLSIVAASLLLLVTGRTLPATELKSLLPSSPDLTGFTITHDPEQYTKENLWDYMNGGAPGYLAYGFEEMMALQVKDLKNHSEIVVDVYDMGNPLNAFGIYSVERIPEGRDLTFGVDSFQYDTTLCFWQDKYYVKLMSYDMQPETAQSLSRLAALITRKLPKKGEPPHLLSIFPAEGRVKKSERYIKCDVLGQAYFTDGYSVDYDNGNNQHKIFLIHGKDPRESGKNFHTYRDFIKTIGQITDEDIKIGEQAFAGTHNFYGRVLFARTGSYIIGVVGFDKQSSAKDTITLMFSKLAHTG
jgi:hypothetical protein